MTTRTNRSLAAGQREDFVTFTIGEQLFGVPILQVQDILGPRPITRIHLAPPETVGLLNLRGRIVTAIDIRHRLGMPPADAPQKKMSVVVAHEGELYSVVVDGIGEVLSLPGDAFERNPPTLDPRWREICSGVYRLDARLLVLIDLGRLLGLCGAARAA